jgi:hypothetical protein
MRKQSEVEAAKVFHYVNGNAVVLLSVAMPHAQHAYDLA